MTYNVDDARTKGQIKTGRTNGGDDQDSVAPRLFELRHSGCTSLVALGTIDSQRFDTVKFEALVR